MNRIVLANGVFDLLHYGHLLYLQAAAKLGDQLFVAVTRNAYVNKGPSRPMFDESQRMAMVAALKCVDHAFLCNDSLDALQLVRPHVFVKGRDYIGKIEKRHEDYCRENNIEIAFTDDPLFSTTRIIHDRFREG